MTRSNTGYSKWVAQLLMVAFLGLWTLAASAGGLSPKDRKQVIEVVQAQLDAFAHDDADKAFSYAAPNIQQMVGNAENFLAMVRAHYDVVYRPASTNFMRPNGETGEAVLQVQMTDGEGSAWTASYTLQRQRNKAWRITGCMLSKTTGTLV